MTATTSSAFRGGVHQGSRSARVTISRRHLPFGTSASRNGGVYHRVAHVAIEWRNGKPIAVGAKWCCTSGTLDVRLSATIPAGARFCVTCPHPDWPQGPHVYLARTADGVLKVGHSGDVRQRLYGLRAELIAALPGEPEMEQRVLLLAPEPVRGREWFAPANESELRAVFAALVAEVAAS